MKKVDFGTRLIEVRKARGLTQEEVAKSCKIATRTIQRIESGSVKPRAFTIRTISDTLRFDFYVTSNTVNDVNSKNQHSTAFNIILWYLKDLFNLKTNRMKKVSILTSIIVFAILGFLAINSQILAQDSSEKKSITIKYNGDKSINRIEVRFNNTLTYDSLVTIKNNLEAYDIKINYKTISFDDNNNLKDISLEAFTKFGKGSFHMLLFDSTRTAGFFCDYSKDAKTKFCIGGCGL